MKCLIFKPFVKKVATLSGNTFLVFKCPVQKNLIDIIILSKVVFLFFTWETALMLESMKGMPTRDPLTF